MFLKYTVNKNRLKREENFDFISHMNNILSFFDNPHKNIRNIIHVGGTNGKGSTINFLGNILKTSGYSVNIFTSPHLININERFNLNGNNVSNEELSKIDTRIEEVASKNKLDISFFEGCVLVSLLLFQEKKADFNLFEVGLGGRYDATNIFDEKLLSIITSISFDHSEILGESIEEIALNKIAIVEENGIAFTAKQNSKVWQMFQAFEEQINCKIYKENIDWNYKKSQKIGRFEYFDFKNHIENIKPSLAGEHQFENASLAIASSLYLKQKGFQNINLNSTKKGIENTKWNCRLQNLDLNYKNLEIILDGAHNEDGIIKLMKYIKEGKQKDENLIGIFAMMQTKDLNCLNIFKNNSIFNKIYLPEVSIKIYEKGFYSSEVLQKEIKKINQNLEVEIFPNFNKDNLSLIFEKENNKNTKIFCFGSLYFVGKILSFYEEI